MVLLASRSKHRPCSRCIEGSEAAAGAEKKRLSVQSEEVKKKRCAAGLPRKGLPLARGARGERAAAGDSRRDHWRLSATWRSCARCGSADEHAGRLPDAAAKHTSRVPGISDVRPRCVSAAASGTARLQPAKSQRVLPARSTAASHARPAAPARAGAGPVVFD